MRVLLYRNDLQGTALKGHLYQQSQVRYHYQLYRHSFLKLQYQIRVLMYRNYLQGTALKGHLYQQSQARYNYQLHKHSCLRP